MSFVVLMLYMRLCSSSSNADREYSVCFQAEDGIRDLVRSRGLGDVYKRQGSSTGWSWTPTVASWSPTTRAAAPLGRPTSRASSCLLYTSDAADERSSVDLGGRRIIKKKKHVDIAEQTDIKHEHESQESQ